MLAKKNQKNEKEILKSNPILNPIKGENYLISGNFGRNFIPILWVKRLLLWAMGTQITIIEIGWRQQVLKPAHSVRKLSYIWASKLHFVREHVGNETYKKYIVKVRQDNSH